MRPVHLLVLPILAVTVAAGALFDTPLARRADAGPATKVTPKQEALIELGRRLFFDPLVSRSGRRSCASCHDPDHGFSDPARVSDDDFGRTRRHSQTLVDGHLNPSAHWDGEFETVEELVLARVGALKGRRSRLAHGASLLEAVSDDASTEIGPESGGGEGGLDEEEEVEEEEDIIDDGEGGGGGDDDENPYGGDGGGKGRGGKVDKKGDGVDKPASKKLGPDAASPSAPDAKGPELRKPAEGKAPAATKKEPKKGEPTKAAKKATPKAAKKEPEATKRPTPEELRARAEKLRADLRKLPLASERIERGGFYAEGFAAAFGNATISTARIARAVAAYCRSIESTTSPYDRYASGDKTALTPAAARGLALFRGRAGCATCHSMSGRRAPFTDFGFHNTGVTWDSLSRRARAQLGRQDEVFRRKKDDLEAPRKVDEGRARVSTLRRDLRAFKTPTLRDVARRGPYMHDGRFKTLKDVVRYYAEGTSDDPAKAKAKGVHGFPAKERDVADLVAFLESLSGEVRPGLPARPWRARADATRLRFVDADGKALAGLKVRLTPVGDVAARDVRGLDELPRATTDDRGWIAYPRTNRTHVRITLPGGLSLEHGALVPDTCAKAKVVVPVRGKTIVVVRLPAGVAAPATLAAVHQGTIVLPGHSAPRTRLVRTHTVESAGANVVRYEGWLRTDVPHAVKVHLPGLHGKAIDAVLGSKEAVRIDVSSQR